VIRGGVGKNWRAGEENKSVRRVKIEETLLWTAYYRNSPTLFRTVPPPTSYGLPFPKIGGSQPPLKTAIEIAGKRVHVDKIIVSMVGI